MRSSSGNGQPRPPTWRTVYRISVPAHGKRRPERTRSASVSQPLIDEALLAEALTREGLVLLQIIQQSKRVFAGSGDYRFAGETLSTRLIGTVGDETFCDISRQRILPPR